MADDLPALTDADLATLLPLMDEKQGGFPEPPSKDTHLKLVRDIVAEEVPERLVRTANLTKEGVGAPRIPSLAYFDIAEYADFENYGMVSRYLRGKVYALAGLSLGKEAKLLNT